MSSKYLFRFITGLMLISSPALCQVLTVGTAGMNVMPGTILSADSLVLMPSATLSLISVSLSSSSVPVSTGGNNSIDKVYTFSAPVHYSGTVGISYTPGDLNGNNAAALIAAYSNAAGGAYTLNCSSIADAADHKVTSSSLSGVNLSGITAVQSTVSVAAITGAGSVCQGGNNTLADATAGGSWSSGSPGIATVSSAGVVTGVTAGAAHITYTITNGCSTAIATTIVTVNGAISMKPHIDNATCNGLPDGYIEADASGGTVPYTYTWSTGGNGLTLANDVYFAPAGVYTVTAADAHGCSLTAAYTVTQPAPLNIATAIANVSCHGSGDGSINTTVTGGTAAYSYLWSNGAHVADPSGLSPGTYGVIITDAHLCIATGSYTITQPAALSLTATATNEICHGSSNGSINTTISGGTSPYVYHWSNGSTAADPTGLAAGTYSVTVTDAHSCTTTGAYTVTQPLAVSLTAAAASVTCNGSSNGAINTAVSNGAPGYTYTWSNGSHLADPAGLTAGTYSVTVTDAHGCTATGAYTITQPAAISLTATAAGVTCNGSSNGAINTTVSSGTPGYTYTWSNGSHLADPGSLAAGTYSVTVTDAHGCTAKGAYTVSQPAIINITATAVNVSCNGNKNGSITTAVSGGTPGYSYAWNTGAHAASLADLGQGTYTLTVTDAHGCTAAHTYIITQPAVLSLTATVTNASCAGCSNGSINTTVSGGMPAYNYVWSDGLHLADPAGLAAATYLVTVTDANGCTVKGSYTITQPAKGGKGSRTTNDNDDTTTGIAITGNIGGEISVLPNPNRGMFSIKGILGTNEDAAVSLEITDMLGQVVYKKNVLAQNGLVNEQVQLSNSLANGMYILNVSSGHQNKVFHIVVEQ